MTCCCHEIKPEQVKTELREVLAALAHEQWSGWMSYLFSLTEVRMHGAEVAEEIPPALVKRWKRQMRTPYDQLGEDEKQSDRVEAERVIALLKGRGYL